MNRQIKYRAWHKGLEDMTFSENEGSQFWFKVTEYAENYYLMQFVSRKSNKDIPIDVYEGDIFQVNNNIKKRYVIIWSDYYCAFIAKSIYSEFTFDLSGKKNFNIIGNIYENPELL